MTCPSVSVILTVYNRTQFLADAINSLLAQTLSNIEIIIIDDGSSNPQVGEIIEQYAKADSRIRVLRQLNQGVGCARNHGVSQATSSYIAFQDDDDYSEPERLACQLEFLKNNEKFAAVDCLRIYIDAHGKPIVRDSGKKLSCTVLFSRITPMIRRQVFLHTGGFRPWFKAAEDLDFGLRFADQSYVCGLVRKHLYRCRRHGEHLSLSMCGWRYACAARHSAFCRQNGLPDPVECPSTRPEDVLEKMQEAPFALRRHCTKMARMLTQQMLSDGNASGAKEMLSESHAYFASDLRSKYYAKKDTFRCLRHAAKCGRLKDFLRA